MKMYVIKDREGVTFGKFNKRWDRDVALKRYCEYGIPDEIEVW